MSRQTSHYAADLVQWIVTDADESLDNLKSNGHTIYYDASNSANEWLDGKTVELNDGGHLKPI